MAIEKKMKDDDKRSLLKKILSGSMEYFNDDIAIVGISGRYPKSRNLEEFWHNLKNGVNCITQVPEDRIDLKEISDFEKNNLVYTRWAGFMDDVDKFDYQFFNILPIEAENSDPQERLYLETVWETLEDGGYTKEELKKIDNSVGVFTGIMNGDYEFLGGYHYGSGNITGAHSSYWSVSNRVSYYFNLNGPSMTVDTACSSSLTSIHLACESIKRKECRMAIAGGVNLILNPFHFFKYCMLNMLSKDEKCKAFGEGANGFVDGEGVGAILLKPLSAAIEDNDNIYAVIKASLINSGGKTRGFTVPNLNAQEDLIYKTIKKSGIDPETINYLEAHGTGTKIGDPIEINAITKAFRRFTQKKQFCAVGSVKTNIGHLESAAGIAGFTKLVLQMKNETIVPSLNAAVLNSEIDFENSAFFVQQKAGRWERVKIADNGKIIEYPRRAGISSFGAGGTNVHMIIEEYKENAGIVKNYQDVLIFILSAKSEDRLKEYCAKYIDFLDKKQEYTPGFGMNMVYTLQNYREHMDVRLAILFKDIKELIDKLKSVVLNLNVGGQDIFIGNLIKNKKNKIKVVNENYDNLFGEKNFRKIAELWTLGSNIDFHEIYKDNKCKRISLPLYPFAKTRCWVSIGNNKINGKDQSGINISALHPLIDTNESTLKEQKFKKSFFKNEIFIKEYPGSEMSSIPPSIFIEMAIASGKLSDKESSVVKLAEINFREPVLFIGSDQDFFINLYPDGSLIDFEIYIEGTKQNQEDKVFCQGKLFYGNKNENNKLNIDNIKSQLNNKNSNFYGYFGDHIYGGYFKIIKDVYYNDCESLSFIQLPGHVNSSYTFSPDILEGIIAVSAFTLYKDDIDKNHIYYPDNISEFIIGNALPESFYIYSQILNFSPNDSNKGKCLNVSLLDINGNVLCIINNLKIKSMPVLSAVPAIQSEDKYAYILEKEWVKFQLPEIQYPESKKNFIILVNSDLKSMIENLFGESRWIKSIVIEWDKYKNNLPENETEFSGIIEKSINECGSIDGLIDFSGLHVVSFNDFKVDWAKIVFFQEIIKKYLNSQFFIFHFSYGLQEYKSRITSLSEADIAAITRLLGAEYKKIIAKNIDIDEKTLNAGKIEEIVLNEMNKNLKGTEILYRDNYRYIPSFKTVYKSKSSDISNGKLRMDPDKPVIITGGTGSIGIELARHLIKYGVRNIVLMGYRELGPIEKWDSIIKNPDTDIGIIKKIDKIKSLITKDTSISIYSGALGNKQNLKDSMNKIKKQYGSIGGVFHCAGIMENKSPAFINKDISSMKKNFEPKIGGLLALYDLLRSENLDFFILFSSISSQIPLLSSGIIDYAAANGFMEYFTYYVNKCESAKKMKVILWPGWLDSTMQKGESQIYNYFELLFHNSSEGMSLLDKCLEYEDKIYFIPFLSKTNDFKIDGLLSLKLDMTNQKGSIDGKNREYHDKGNNELIDWMKNIFSQEMRLSIEQLDEDKSIIDFGIDSIFIAELVKRLEKELKQSIEPSIFFEYSTIRALCGYISNNYKIDGIGIEETKKDMHDIAGKKETSNTEKKYLEPLKITKRFSYDRQTNPESRIAVIGIACNFPLSPSKEIFWENLTQGKLCISEVPKSRWDVNSFYHPTFQKGKTISKWGGFIDDIEYFDPEYFKIDKNVASHYDPLIRQFLETTVQCIRDAGYDYDELSNTLTGVFVGSRTGNYSYRISMPLKESVTGIGQNFIAAHISHFFNLKGPNMLVDTACSSSLVSIHLACQSLHLGESNMAIAGGVDILLDEMTYIGLSEAKALSPDGKCYTFDQRANGFVPGEGCGAVLLKRLEDAIRDNDKIYAVIESSAVNNDGRTMGITTPNPEAQSAVIKSALDKSDISADTISYIEAHGTGTLIGDPIELKALTKVFNQVTNEKNFCAVGSVKSNIGHLLSAAGIASFIKVALSLYHKKIPPTINCEIPNARFNFHDSPFYPVKQLTEWKQRSNVRRAGISSFGFGGTNAHMILSDLDSKKFSGYIEKRNSLPPVIFNKKYYWSDKTGKKNNNDSNFTLLELSKEN